MSCSVQQTSISLSFLSFTKALWELIHARLEKDLTTFWTNAVPPLTFIQPIPSVNILFKHYHSSRIFTDSLQNVDLQILESVQDKHHSNLKTSSLECQPIEENGFPGDSTRVLIQAIIQMIKTTVLVKKVFGWGVGCVCVIGVFCLFLN